MIQMLTISTGLLLAGLVSADSAKLPSKCFDPEWQPTSSKAVYVNGHKLTKKQKENVLYIKSCVFPYLSGTPEEKATIAARTTWWALREGVLDMSRNRSMRYSNCHENGKDRNRTESPLHPCPKNISKNIWQVGLAAGQVMNYTMDEIKDQIKQIWGENSDFKQVLSDSAKMAGICEEDKLHKEIVNSEGRVRRSWFMRNPLIAFRLVAKQEVVNECIKSSKRWCFSSFYPSAKKFARNKSAMNKTIKDLKGIFNSSELSPDPDLTLASASRAPSTTEPDLSIRSSVRSAASQNLASPRPRLLGVEVPARPVANETELLGVEVRSAE